MMALYEFDTLNIGSLRGVFILLALNPFVKCLSLLGYRHKMELAVIYALIACSFPDLLRTPVIRFRNTPSLF